MGFIENFRQSWHETEDSDPVVGATFELEAYGSNAKEASGIIRKIKRGVVFNLGKMAGAGAVGFALGEVVRHSWEDGIMIGGITLALTGVLNESKSDSLFQQLNELRLPDYGEQEAAS